MSGMIHRWEGSVAVSSARAEERVNAQRHVRVRASGPDMDAHVLDASSRGMLLSAANPPERGEIIEVTVGSQIVVGQVRWARGNQFGVKLGDRINVEALVAGRGGPICASHPPAAMAVEAEEADETGIAYNLIFFAAAAVASLGFLLTALNKTIG